MPKETQIEGVKVRSFSGEDRGKFDATHIVGSEVLRGSPADVAIDRSYRVRDIVELATHGEVSTDSIRYVLDGLRDVEPGSHLHETKLRDFKNHIVQRSPGNGEVLPAQEGPVFDLGALDQNGGEGEGEAGGTAGGTVYEGPRPALHSKARKDCSYQVLSRETTVSTVVRCSPWRVSKVESELFRSTEIDKTAEEIKLVLEGKLSADFSYGDFGIDASISGQALLRKLTEFTRTSTFVIGKFTTKLEVTVTVFKRATVEEVWGWVGTDCDPSLGQPDTYRYTVDGDAQQFPAHATIVTYEKRLTEARLSSDADIQKEAKAEGFRLIQRGNFPETPWPDVPSPMNFSSSNP